jgi:hypothetical protein
LGAPEKRHGEAAKKPMIAWWAREDSSLQPSGYERATIPDKVNEYQHFRARSVTNVRIWLRRFIGYLLVERDRKVPVKVRYRLPAG